MNIIELAKEAGFELGTAWYGSSKVLERFAALVAEATKAQPQGEWVDLTDDEIDEIESKILMAGGEHNDIYRAVIAADREKNRG